MCVLLRLSQVPPQPSSQPAPRPAVQPGSCMLQTTTTRTGNAAADVANTADSSAALRLELCENLRSLAIASFLCLN